jgi:hypothetical protein
VGKNKTKRRIKMSEAKVITAKVPSTGRECSIAYDFGSNCDEAVEKFGDEAVFSAFVSKSVITAQSAMRRFMEAGLSDEEIQAKMDTWKPGVAMERTVDPVAALMGKFGSMTAEEQQELLSKLQARAAS